MGFEMKTEEVKYHSHPFILTVYAINMTYIEVNFGCWAKIVFVRFFHYKIILLSFSYTLIFSINSLRTTYTKGVEVRKKLYLRGVAYINYLEFLNMRNLYMWDYNPNTYYLF